MSPNEYQSLAMRTNSGDSTCQLSSFANAYKFYSEELLINIDVGGIINACLGLSGEVGEFNDMIKKWVFHETELDIEHLKKECGDVLWYVAMMCHSFGWKMEEIMEINIEKLKARYPDGFDTYLANHRSEEDV